MKNILLLGAGRSTSALIGYLLRHAGDHDWYITIGDQHLDFVQQKVGNSACAEAIVFNVLDSAQVDREVEKADIVISMLPARFHHLIAGACVKHGKSMVTASYLSSEINTYEQEARDKGIILLNEIGLDPGLDHMSAMKTLDRIRKEGHQMHCFESFTGGLVAPECDNNPWGYKFTWNPRNVVIAGQGSPVKFRQEDNYKYIPYHRLFRRTEIIEIEEYGRFEGYPNRDSLKYIDYYGLEKIPTIFRGTLRRPGFCRAWNVFVQLGATDDSYIIENSEEMTYREFINLFLAYNPHDSVELKLMHYLKIDQDSDIMEKLEWLGIFEKRKIGLKNATPAQILQHLLEEKWALDKEDKDMIVMWNKFEYNEPQGRRLFTSSMVVKGDDTQNTAMAKTVGLPLAIATRLILEGKLQLTGVQIPTAAEIYEPVLAELETLGIGFTETDHGYLPA